MTCEFTSKVRQATRDIVKEVFDKLSPEDQRKFKTTFGPVYGLHEGCCYRAYYHCKNLVDEYKRRKIS